MGIAISPLRWVFAIAAVASVTGLTMCQSPTQILVSVTTDVACDDAPSTVITIGRPETIDATLVAATTASCDRSTNRVGSLVIVPSGARDEAVAFRVVMGFAGRAPEDCVTTGNYEHCIVARRALRYIPHASLQVPIAMRAQCTGVPCDATHTCVKGVCVSSTIDDPTRCESQGGCDETALAPGGVDGGVSDAGDAGGAGDASEGGAACVGACAAGISAGDGYVCRAVNGQSLCWGTNNNNELGRGSSGSPDPNEMPAMGLTGVVSVSSGLTGTCARRSDGSASCWGYMPAIDLLAPGRNVRAPTDIPQLKGSPWIAIDNHVLCWKGATGVLCAGANDSGQLGQGDLMARPQPIAPKLPPGDVAGMSAGNETVCAVMADGSVWCWGGNSYGEGDPTNFSSGPAPTPKKVDLGAFGARAIDVSVGEVHVCVIMQDTTVVCWGDASRGETGHTPALFGFPPQRVLLADGTTPLAGATRVSVGWKHSCAIVAGGKVACWGGNEQGQLGRGIAVDSGIIADEHPAQIAGLGAASAIASGVSHTCAIIGAEVWCWGDNQTGAIGLDPIATPFVPAPRRVR